MPRFEREIKYRYLNNDHAEYCTLNTVRRRLFCQK